MITGAIWGRTCSGDISSRPPSSGKMSSACSCSRCIPRIVALAMNAFGPRGQMFPGAGRIRLYFVNAAQFLLKLRCNAARPEFPHVPLAELAQ